MNSLTFICNNFAFNLASRYLIQNTGMHSNQID